MGDLRLFIWGGRAHRVDANRRLGSYIFHWFRKNPVKKHFGHAFHVNIKALIMDTVGE